MAILPEFTRVYSVPNYVKIRRTGGECRETEWRILYDVTRRNVAGAHKLRWMSASYFHRAFSEIMKASEVGTREHVGAPSRKPE